MGTKGREMGRGEEEEQGVIYPVRQVYLAWHFGFAGQGLSISHSSPGHSVSSTTARTFAFRIFKNWCYIFWY